MSQNVSSKSENGPITKSTPSRKRAPYLPRGLRQRLADHFHLTIHAIDWRIRHGHPETIRVAKQMAQDDYDQKMRSLKLAKQKRRIHELKVRAEIARIARPNRKDEQLTFLEDLREADRA